jgi:NADH dehydrogenase
MPGEEQAYDMNIPSTEKIRVVVIGAGFGGINLVKRLNGNLFQIVLLDRYNYHAFQPLLYQVATAGLEPDSVAVPLRKLFRKKHDFHFRMLTVRRVDPDTKRIFTSIGSLSYDYLVVATGSSVNFFENRSIAKHAYPVKQITQALDLRSDIFQQLELLSILKDGNRQQAYLNFVVVGAGPTGVEICGALAELKNKVLRRDYRELGINSICIYLVEGEDRVLPQMSKESGLRARRYLEKMGIKVILGCLTDSYDGSSVKLNNGMEIETKTLIWAAGVKGKAISGLAEKAYHQGMIKVNAINQVCEDPGHSPPREGLFAIGDVAFMPSDKYHGGLPGLAPVAIQQGKHLARNLNLLVQNKPAINFKYKDKGVMATIGRNKAVADFPGGVRLYGFTGWISWMLLHLVFLIGFRNKAVVLANWVWNYFTYDRGMRLIIRPPSKEKDRISRDMAREMAEDSIGHTGFGEPKKQNQR